jgi:uncharacterized protein YidB (DUF937 family)
MGLIDILNGMQNGPRGQKQPSSAGGSGGMSPTMMALLGLLAYKALKSFGGGAQPASPGAGGRPASLPGAGTPTPLPGGGTVTAGNPGGGLGDILGGLLGGKPGVPSAAGKPGASLNELFPGGLGGLLGGAAAGSVLSGGLDKLIKGFQDSGHAKVAQSWVGTGPNQEIAPHDLAAALGGDTIDALTKQTGLGREDLLAGLSQNLPELIDQLTPDGRLPSAEEASRMV